MSKPSDREALPHGVPQWLRVEEDGLRERGEDLLVEALGAGWLGQTAHGFKTTCCIAEQLARAR
jgi:hypothetical protein